MQKRKIKTIRTQVLRLLMTTISFLIFFSCLAFIYSSSVFVKSMNLEQLDRILNQLYHVAITDTKAQAISEANEIRDILKLYSDDMRSDSTPQKVYNSIVSTQSDRVVWLLDKDKNVLAGSDAPLLSPLLIENILSHTSEAWIDGTLELGIYAFHGLAITHSSHRNIAYIITAERITNKNFVQRINDSFGIDASIFYKDLRIVTTVKDGQNDAVYTQLDEKIYKKLKSTKEDVIGQSIVVGTPYLAAYRYFGNSDDAIVGIVAVGKSMSSYLQFIINLCIGVIVSGIILLIVTSRLSYTWMNKNIVIPIKNTRLGLVYIAKGGKDYHKYFSTAVKFDEFKQLNTAIEELIGDVELSKAKIEKIAYYDELSRLPNRFYLYNRWSHREKHDLNASYLIYIDIDNLRMVNDLLGHKIGDKLIIGIGSALQNIIKKLKSMELYHFGGGQYVIFCDSCEDENKIEEFVRNLIASFDEPFYFDSNTVNITITVGIASCNYAECIIENLVQQAEIAMHQTKKEHKGNYSFYTSQMVERLKAQSDFEDDLKKALDNDEFFVVYQPKLNLITKECTNFEALIRWNSPTRGIVSPLEFIQVAEDIGLIIPIGQWVLEQACEFVKKVQQNVQQSITVSVNVSSLQILKEDFVKTVLSTLISFGLRPHSIELEITESVLIEYLSTSVERLRQLSALGVDIAIDDFGKGYSSLAYLKRLPITMLKIDKLFIDDISEKKNSLVDHIIDIGHHMGLKVIAEGVETQQQVDFLVAAKCDYIQGYYYSHPLKEEDAINFLTSRRIN
jgi:diguanylate cyclase (GGDEF)-like protein